MWSGLVWLRIGTGGELLWIRYWTFGFHEMLGNYLVASRVVLSSIELVMSWHFVKLSFSSRICEDVSHGKKKMHVADTTWISRCRERPKVTKQDVDHLRCRFWIRREDCSKLLELVVQDLAKAKVKTVQHWKEWEMNWLSIHAIGWNRNNSRACSFS
jgi:hypothetical protein